jgi:hypothetical protein
MKNILIIIAILAVAALAYYFYDMRSPLNQVEVLPPAVITQPEPIQPSRIEPLDATPTAEPPVVADDSDESVGEPVPALTLEQSDPVVLESINELVGEATVMQQVVAENIIPRLVATIDALTARQLSPNHLPLQPPAGALEVTEDTHPENPRTTAEGDPVREYILDPVNTRRYASYVELLESVATADLIDQYREFQPLFQQAFTDLGYPNGDFNTRLLEVVDHLLETPDVSEPVRLIKPEAYYLFADPRLESLSAGQKLFIRMGSSNARRVKDKLREFRVAL